MKYAFLGDPEFTFGSYWDLPVPYVLEAFEFSQKQKRRDLHSSEAPVALLTSVMANANRDSKKKKEPYTMEDFFLFKPIEDRNIPTNVYGAAAMVLAEKRLLPTWALFIYKDLKEAASGPAPQLLAFLGEDAIILAPQFGPDHVKGMVVGKESARAKRRTLTSPCGKTIYVEIPDISGKFFAEEDLQIPLIS